jgi:hypothetical protein
MLGERAAEQTVVAEVLRDHRGIGVEIEEAPDSLDDEQERPWIGEANRKTE